MDDLLDDEIPSWAVEEDEEEDSKPEWLGTELNDINTEANPEASPEASFLMMRMSSFFLSTVQPQLELFVQNHKEQFHAESLTLGETPLFMYHNNRHNYTPYTD
jgi:hypothetical protein